MKIIKKEPRKFGFTLKKSLDKPNKENKECGQKTNIPSSPKCFGYQGYGHMKQECPTYLMSIGKSKALTATLSDTKPKSDSNDNDQEEKIMAFTAIVELANDTREAVSEREELDESKFEKLDENDDIQIAYSKIYKFF